MILVWVILVIDEKSVLWDLGINIIQFTFVNN